MLQVHESDLQTMTERHDREAAAAAAAHAAAERRWSEQLAGQAAETDVVRLERQQALEQLNHQRQQSEQQMRDAEGRKQVGSQPALRH